MLKNESFLILTLLAVCISVSYAAEGGICKEGSVVSRIDNSDGVLNILCKQYNCSGFDDEKAQCSEGFDFLDCATNQWMSGIERQESNTDYELQCCSHSLMDDSSDRPLVVVQSGEFWEAKEYQDDKGRPFIDVPYDVRRISGADYYLYTRQVRCRPPPPPNNNLDVKLPDRPGFQKYEFDDANNPGSTVEVIYGTCFSPENVVQTLAGPKLMGDLQSGDMVQTVINGGMLDYRPILFFLHRDHEMVAEFVEVETSSGKVLSLSPKHLIYRFPCNESYPFWNFNFRNVELIAFADELQEGQCIAKQTEGNLVIEEVTRLARVQKTGVYSPITDTGVIVVEDIVASCYSQSKDVQAAKSWLHKSFLLLQRFKHIMPTSIFEWFFPSSHLPKAEIPTVVSLMLNYLPVVSSV